MTTDTPSVVGQGRFGRIALALSGGGFRAAAFHLGTMKALEELDLLKDVRLLSTASGGSIIGARWVLSIAAGHSFEEFEREMHSILERNILAEALDVLHVGKKRPSLIQRAAEVYDGMFGGKRLGALANDSRLTARIDHVVINATHFSLGYGFRFTFPPRRRAPFGNTSIKTIEPENAWADIRLADAVAASSCFPAGFEPLVFPHDFGWSGESPKVKASGVRSDETEEALPLMDGGIFDNQAADALLLISRASKNTEDPGDDVGLLFCSDTDQKQMPYYAPTRRGWLWRILDWLPLGLVASAMALGAAGLARFASEDEGRTATAAIVGATLLGTPVLLLLGLLIVAQIVTPFRYRMLSWRLLRTTVGDLASLVGDRIASVLSLTTKVFMYRVRALGYDVARLKMPNRLVESHIYDAAAKSGFGASAAVIEQARAARGVPTALWMTPKERSDVVATGRATAVGSLRRYLRAWQKAEADGEVFRAGERYPADLGARVEAAWVAINTP